MFKSLINLATLKVHVYAEAEFYKKKYKCLLLTIIKSVSDNNIKCLLVTTKTSVTDDKNVCYWRQKLGDVDNRLRSKWFKIMKAGAGAGVQAQLQVQVKMQVQVCKLRCRWRCRCRCASAGADEDAGAGVQAQMQVQVWRWRCVTDEKSVRYWRQKLVHRVKGSTSQEFHESRVPWVKKSMSPEFHKSIESNVNMQSLLTDKLVIKQIMISSSPFSMLLPPPPRTSHLPQTTPDSLLLELVVL